MDKEQAKEIKSQVMDLLNQIVILTKDVPDAQYRENYNGVPTPVTEDEYKDILSDYDSEDEEDLPKDVDGEPLVQPDDNSVYCSLVRTYAKRVVDGDVGDAAYNEQQYYTSNC